MDVNKSLLLNYQMKQWVRFECYQGTRTGVAYKYEFRVFYFVT
jgi:hypothetical protein